jgi:hypothetical protein
MQVTLYNKIYLFVCFGSEMLNSNLIGKYESSNKNALLAPLYYCVGITI